MNWDKFVITKSGKAIINEKIELDIIELQSGRYFLDKKAFETLMKYTPDELKKDLTYSIYTLVGHVADGQSGITSKITDTKKLNDVIREIEESLVKL